MATVLQFRSTQERVSVTEASRSYPRKREELFPAIMILLLMGAGWLAAIGAITVAVWIVKLVGRVL